MADTISKQTLEDWILAKVKEKLNAEKIQLWMPPYTTENQEKGEISQDMLYRFALDLGFNKDDVADAFEKLRMHAVVKLAERNRFKSSAIATLNVKSVSEPKAVSIEMTLDSCGADLRQAVAERCGINASLLKLITGGRVINDGQQLCRQNINIWFDCAIVQHNSRVLAVVLQESEAESRALNERCGIECAEVNLTRKAAELLSDKVYHDDDDEVFAQITDQQGRSLSIPRDERKALTLALVLNEKGRAALKLKKYSMALLLLLEADSAFRNCRAEILQMVDNYAILCLDIVWCYLCLENINELPDADNRLQMCESNFAKTYGVKNERLKQLKHGADVERILLMRLHLLQGIVAFHKLQVERSHGLLHQAVAEYNLLQVNPDVMAELIGMGFGVAEARLALRACSGDLSNAVNYIVCQRQKKLKMEGKVKLERENRRLSSKYGKCANGECKTYPGCSIPAHLAVFYTTFYELWLIMENVRSLVDMNFPQAAAAEALKMADNKVGKALDLLKQYPELLNTPEVSSKRTDLKPRDSDITSCVELGFDVQSVLTALRRNENVVEKAVEDLIKYNGALPYSSDESSSTSPSTSSSSSAESETTEERQLKQKQKEERQIIEKLIDGMSRNIVDHLDMDISEEKQFIDEYLAKLNSLK